MKKPFLLPVLLCLLLSVQLSWAQAEKDTRSTRESRTLIHNESSAKAVYPVLSQNFEGTLERFRIAVAENEAPAVEAIRGDLIKLMQITVEQNSKVAEQLAAQIRTTRGDVSDQKEFLAAWSNRDLQQKKIWEEFTSLKGKADQSELGLALAEQFLEYLQEQTQALR